MITSMRNIAYKNRCPGSSSGSTAVKWKRQNQKLRRTLFVLDNEFLIIMMRNNLVEKWSKFQKTKKIENQKSNEILRLDFDGILKYILNPCWIKWQRTSKENIVKEALHRYRHEIWKNNILKQLYKFIWKKMNPCLGHLPGLFIVRIKHTWVKLKFWFSLW